WDKPLSFTQNEFISAIGLPICKDTVPLPPKETVRAGLMTLGLFDKNKPTLSFAVLVNSSPLKMKLGSKALKWEEEQGIEYLLYKLNFLKSLNSLCSLPSGEVNANDTADKSLSRPFMYPVIQSKATTDLKTKKKKILPSSKPKSSYKLLDQSVKKEKDAEFVAIDEGAKEQSLEFPIVEQLLDEADKLNKAV
ncbi:hypothetical protein Tco_1511099, partial [Tanacetum coccineum]